MSVEKITEARAREIVADYDRRYPLFREAYGDCCALTAVAEEYGWPVANNDWSEYSGYRFLLGDD